MNIKEFKDYISSLVSHVLFEFNGKNCGVDPLSKDKFDIWYGEEMHTVGSVDEVMSIPIFNGQSLTQIFNMIKNIDY